MNYLIGNDRWVILERFDQNESFTSNLIVIGSFPNNCIISLIFSKFAKKNIPLNSEVWFAIFLKKFNHFKDVADDEILNKNFM